MQGKGLTTLQQRALERRQQILTSQRRFNTGGLRSDQIVRAQRRAQYEQKMTRMKYEMFIHDYFTKDNFSGTLFFFTFYP